MEKRNVFNFVDFRGVVVPIPLNSVQDFSFKSNHILTLELLAEHSQALKKTHWWKDY